MDIEKIKKRISSVSSRANEIVVKSFVYENKYIDGTGLSIEELLVAVIYAYNTLPPDDSIYFCMTKKNLKKYFDWSDYKIRKMVKSIPEIVVRPMWDDEGYLCGKGYVIDVLT